MLHSFSLARFRFVLEAEGRLALHPRNPGNTLRGAFGSTFKRLVCPAPSECRDTCRLKATCPYGQIFEPSPPPDTDRLSLNQDIPRPFVLRPPNGGQTLARTGEPLPFDLILIGVAVDYLPYFLVTFRELGQQGIGIGRGRYTIRQVLLLRDAEIRSSPPEGEGMGEGVPIYSATDQLVRPSPDRVRFEDCCRLAKELVDHNPSRVTIRFLTPTHLKANGAIVSRPDFHHFVKRLRDRINALAHFYCQDTLDVDYKAFGERAEVVRTVHYQVRWEDRDRRSWRTGLAHDMGGFIGEVTYEGNVQEFLPLLILGQYTHVGKYAVWGNGQYEMVVL
jgi:hypothetical protein